MVLFFSIIKIKVSKTYSSNLSSNDSINFFFTELTMSNSPMLSDMKTIFKFFNWLQSHKIYTWTKKFWNILQRDRHGETKSPMKPEPWRMSHDGLSLSRCPKHVVFVQRVKIFLHYTSSINIYYNLKKIIHLCTSLNTKGIDT